MIRWFLRISLVFLIAFGAAARGQAAVQFTTIAGSGAPGVTDGPASQASFLLPYGVAVAKDGTIYVSDFQAQRIRAISKDHWVTTVAGGGDVDKGTLSVPAGYVNGPGAVARFSDPAGIAIGPDGKIYVADSGNKCIRVIDRGFVSTFAGSPSTPVRDGTIATAGFSEPRALTFDSQGNLWVGDFEAGIRKISPAGIVTTIPIPDRYKKYVSSISIEDGGLLVVDYGQFIFVKLQADGSYAFVPPGGPGDPQGGISPGDPFMAAQLPNGQYVFTDEETQAVREGQPFEHFYEDLSRPPTDQYGIEGAGFLDGDGPQALVQEPLGIAALNSSSVVFADGGNRRIRTISNIETRHNARPSNPMGDYGDATKYYRVLLLGDCFVDWGIPFEETIGGLLEKQLNEHRKEFGIPREVRVADAFTGRPEDVENYVRDVASSGAVDLVIWEFNDADPNFSFVPGRDTLTDPHIKQSEWQASLTPRVVEMGKLLKAANVPYYVLLQPTPRYYPAIEMPEILMLPHEPGGTSWDSIVSVYKQMLAGTSDGIIDAGPAMMKAENSPNRHLLFIDENDEYQTSVAGDALLEGLLYARLAQDRPWSKSP